jgi:molybdopterin-guanine dinucleotide biosynthesis protein A
MSTASEAEPAGRLANVSAALIVPAAEHPNAQLAPMAERSKLLERLFEDVVVIVGRGVELSFDVTGRVIEPEPGERSALLDLAIALAAAREEQVLVLAADLAGVTPDLVLALTAWPEHDCVAPRIEGAVQPLCGLYRRETALRAAREALERGESDPAALLAELDCGILEGKDLAALLPEASLP